ncbi:hypothetical protein NHQ30_011671 [Ciborinia camelliae]|nr:hypothetical protein NHQ30_011671 [Ciborinia camelliae]
MSKSSVGRPDEWQQDIHGHGTQHPSPAEIYIGKICNGKVINDEFMPGIAKAIDWAVNEFDARIPSMSFEFEDDKELIDAALENAIDAGKLIIAAALNNGGLSGRARPAHQDGVIRIHATDGKGNKGGMNPSPMANGDIFATLGISVPSKWKGNEVWKWGTSFAVPIAELLQVIFGKIGEMRDGYDFLHPLRLWKDWQDTGTEREAEKAIEDTIEHLYGLGDQQKKVMWLI